MLRTNAVPFRPVPTLFALFRWSRFWLSKSKPAQSLLVFVESFLSGFESFRKRCTHCSAHVADFVGRLPLSLNLMRP